MFRFCEYPEPSFTLLCFDYFLHTLIALRTNQTAFAFLSFAVSQKTIAFSVALLLLVSDWKTKVAPPHICECLQIDTHALSPPSMCTCMQTHTRSLFLLVHSQKRPDTAVFSSVEVGTDPSPANNSLTSARAAVIAV